jgi:small conductance mechanosensitive channel
MDWNKLMDKAPEFITTHGLKLLTAILIYIIGAWIARALSNWVRKLMGKRKVDTALVTFLGNLVYVLLLIFVILAAIGRLGVQTTSFVAILAAAGLAVGLALQGSLSNFAAGVMLILFKPFKIGDSVTAGGNTGTVLDIGIFHTIIATSDNKKIILPNSAVSGGAITNFSAMPTRRVELTVSVPGAADMNKVRDILLGILNAESRVLQEPAASISIADATAGEIKFGVAAHVKNADLGPVQSSILEKIKLALTEAGIWA